MSSTYYKLQRIKLENLPVGKNQIDIYKVGYTGTEKIGTKTVIVKGKECETPDEYKYLKYLSSDGKYRFIKFSSIYTTQTNNTLIGNISKLVTDLKTGQSDKYNIGYQSEKSITLKTYVTNDEYKEYINVFRSPRVYLQINETSDLNDGLENWLLVTVTDSGNVFNSKKNSQNFSITVTLPSLQNIVM